MANYLLSQIPELHDVMIFVDPFKKKGSLRLNLRPLRRSIEWLNSGGALVIFPAGEVSHLRMGMRQVTDPEWNTSVARIVRRTGASVLPMFFRGSNGPLFQTLGFVHPRMRTILLPHEFLKMRDRILEVEVGSVISPERLQSFDTDSEVTEFLRRRTYLLNWRQALMPTPACLSSINTRPKPGTPIAEPSNRELLAGEIEQLDSGQILARSGDLQVICARARQIPLALREIGIQRETAFRASGEGSGNALDIDGFDKYYIHLLLWDRTLSCIAGGYRIGHVDEIIETLGIKGLYTSTLFRMKVDIFAKLGATLELGRSFIRQQNQRDSVSLPLLWKGIASYVARYPGYRTLFGPVSISDDYLQFSKQLIREFAAAHHAMGGSESEIKPRNPLRTVTPMGWSPGSFRRMVRDIDDLSEWISEVEPDGKSLPILLRHYLKLGGRIAAFNVDRQFSNVVDGLIFVDLLRVDPRVLARMMGRETAASYLAFHGRAAALKCAS